MSPGGVQATQREGKHGGATAHRLTPSRPLGNSSSKEEIPLKENTLANAIPSAWIYLNAIGDTFFLKRLWLGQVCPDTFT